MHEKRRNIRVPHEGPVNINAEGRTFPGKVVDVSRNGMKVVAYMPVDYDQVYSLEFDLPQSKEPLVVPGRMTRSTGKRDEDGQELGFQFSFQTEAQLILIENFIRHRKSLELTDRSAEDRQVPRAACDIREVGCDRAGLSDATIADISTEGLLLYFNGSLAPQDSCRLEFSLPGDGRPLRASVRATYVVRNEFRGISAAGMRFEELSTVDRTRLHNFILTAITGNQADSLYGRLGAGSIGDEFRIADQAMIASLLRGLKRRRGRLNILKEKSFTIVEAALAGFDEKRRRFSLKIADVPDRETVNDAGVLNCSFHLDGGTYYFTAAFLSDDGRMIHFGIPAVVIRCEKRSYGRKSMGTTMTLHAGTDQAGHGLALAATLVDISRRGFLCEVDWADGLRDNIKPGSRISFELDETLGLQRSGLVRHVSIIEANGQAPRLRFGVESGLKAPNRLKRVRYSRRHWQALPVSTAGRLGPAAALPGRIVRFEDRLGRPIAAIANALEWGRPADVFVIPPAFGKKKEALAGLAATLLATWRGMGRNIAVLRYDGVNRPGESFNLEMHPKRGYEMLGYRLSQGSRDLAAVLDFVRTTELFAAEHTVLISFSMAALDVRKVLLEAPAESVDLWLSCMGIPAVQNSLRNILGGIDILANHRMGVTNGLAGLLGHLVDMDILAEDAIQHKFAFTTDARFDMARLDVPAVWIYGADDRWIDPEEVRDVMGGGGSGAPRELIEVPTGHNLRTSDDALKVFRILASTAWRKLHGGSAAALAPDKADLVGIITAERERLERHEKLEHQAYWREYLIGKSDDSAGYDFYRNLKEFRAFLDRQLDLLDLRPGQHVADLGCGTGLLLERLVQRCANAGAPRICAIDLVPEALGRAGAKAARALGLGGRPSAADCSSYSMEANGLRLDFQARDLAPCRFEPLRRFRERPSLPVGYLRGRIEGLTSSLVDVLESAPAGLVSLLLRGGGLESARALAEISRSMAPDPAALETLEELRLASGIAGGAPVGKSFLRLGLAAPRPAPASAELGPFDRIAASLFISYIFNPEYLIEDFFDMLRPGGLLLLSSMRPDSDISVIFTDFVQEVQGDKASPDRTGAEPIGGSLENARDMLNEAASLLELEEEGYFKFYRREELLDLLAAAGFIDLHSEASLGDPPQAYIATGKKPMT